MSLVFSCTGVYHIYPVIRECSDRLLEWQIKALREVHEGDLPADELLQPETLLPGCVGSKRYREEPDAILNQMLGGMAKSILVWGAGDGFFEADLLAQGYNVTVYPLNGVMDECCRQRGLIVLPSEGQEPLKHGPL